ncbi:MAG: transglycosylase SLT domain-containing protein [Deltaproteobacteria bacterium]|nr:transglycosylase SLT domain-containing protein [Deltaproteobacteria bacterium]
MADIWSSYIMPKKGGYGVGDVSPERMYTIISDSANVWAGMGLTHQQIAFGIATMGVESGFNPAARNPSTARGLGQFRDKTWPDAVKHYNKTYGQALDPVLSRENTASQIMVMGAWIEKLWPTAEKFAREDPALTVEYAAYGLWHEGQNRDITDVKNYLENPKKFDNADIKGYFGRTLEGASSVMEIRRRFGTIDRGTGETLRREGNHVYRVETDGSTRGFFISE